MSSTRAAVPVQSSAENPGGSSDESAKPAPLPFARVLPWLMVLGGGVGFLGAFGLIYEEIQTLIDPSHVAICSLNPIISCGSVMASEQASVFGFPNPVIGVAAFPMVVAAGAALLAGARFKRWYWLGLQVGVTFGICFVGWLIFQSLYRINALCPYCMVVWTVTIPLFLYVTLANLDRGHLPVPAALRGTVDALRRNHAPLLAISYLVVLVLVLHRFWYYWSTVLDFS
ncbi:vitamin K epoxide reductase family protein [Segeticoccus rhizosphaerae]|jgi:uncharacterized membrane protein|uniref:vitamin K epoxide reductase family protein n=1 Tax=Segeticoccus rhizosphaerae TaxID=1104777 RepID=UPI001264A4D8|nr:vitamin K epoxide reductase family protein [Segeticoccus rhizosphaerae]